MGLLSRNTPSSLSSLRKNRSARVHLGGRFSSLANRVKTFPDSSNKDKSSSLLFTHPGYMLGLALSLFLLSAIIVSVPPEQVERVTYLPFLAAVFSTFFFSSALLLRSSRRGLILAYIVTLIVIFKIREMMHWYVMMLVLPLLFIEVILTKMKKQ